MQQFYLRISKVYTVAGHFVGKAYVKFLSILHTKNYLKLFMFDLIILKIKS